MYFFSVQHCSLTFPSLLLTPHHLYQPHYYFSLILSRVNTQGLCTCPSLCLKHSSQTLTWISPSLPSDLYSDDTIWVKPNLATLSQIAHMLNFIFILLLYFSSEYSSSSHIYYIFISYLLSFYPLNKLFRWGICFALSPVMISVPRTWGFSIDAHYVFVKWMIARYHEVAAEYNLT